jgi:hypothetical protein
MSKTDRLAGSKQIDRANSSKNIDLCYQESKLLRSNVSGAPSFGRPWRQATCLVLESQSSKKPTIESGYVEFALVGLFARGRRHRKAEAGW